MNREMERTVTRADARIGDGEETRSGETASTSSSPDAAFTAGKKVDAASPPGLGGYAPLSPALSGYLLKERRHSVSEYCQPLKLYLDILMFMTSFRNIDLLKQGYVMALFGIFLVWEQRIKCRHENELKHCILCNIHLERIYGFITRERIPLQQQLLSLSLSLSLNSRNVPLCRAGLSLYTRAR